MSNPFDICPHCRSQHVVWHEPEGMDGILAFVCATCGTVLAWQCDYCGGEGAIEDIEYYGEGVPRYDVPDSEPCPDCHGRGWIEA